MTSSDAETSSQISALSHDDHDHRNGVATEDEEDLAVELAKSALPVGGFSSLEGIPSAVGRGSLLILDVAAPYDRIVVGGKDGDDKQVSHESAEAEEKRQSQQSSVSQSEDQHDSSEHDSEPSRKENVEPPTPSSNPMSEFRSFFEKLKVNLANNSTSGMSTAPKQQQQKSKASLIETEVSERSCEKDDEKADKESNLDIPTLDAQESKEEEEAPPWSVVITPTGRTYTAPAPAPPTTKSPPTAKKSPLRSRDLRGFFRGSSVGSSLMEPSTHHQPPEEDTGLPEKNDKEEVASTTSSTTSNNEDGKTTPTTKHTQKRSIGNDFGSMFRGSSFLGGGGGGDESTDDHHDHHNDPDVELAHQFKTHTYNTPTNCDICDGLLVGLWSQGLQCRECGMNVHRGQGKGEHDDCRAEALLMTSCRPCCTHQEQASLDGNSTDDNSNGGGKTRANSDGDKAANNNRLQEAIREVRELAKSSPYFLRDIKEQMDRDMKSHAKNLIVASSAEDERSKNLRRLKERVVVPFVEKMDRLQERAPGFRLGVLLYYQMILAGIVSATFIVTVFGLLLLRSLLWGTTISSSLIVLHTSTVLMALHGALFLLALGIRKVSFIFQRKANLLNQFLRDVLTIHAKADIGISVAGAASRCRTWSHRLVVSTWIMWLASILLWHCVQPVMMAKEENGSEDTDEVGMFDTGSCSFSCTPTLPWESDSTTCEN